MVPIQSVVVVVNVVGDVVGDVHMVGDVVGDMSGRCGGGRGW